MDPSAPRTLRTLIALHEESSGACVAYPVMRPEWAAFGDRDDVLTELRHRGLVRTYNAPIGDLAEYCAAIVYDGLLAPNSEKSYDLVAVDGRKVQVKVRVRRADTSSSATFSVIRSFDFDVCLFLLIDSDGEVAAAREWTVQEVRDAGRHKPHINGSVVRLSQVTSGSALGIDRLAEFRQAGRELAAQTR